MKDKSDLISLDDARLSIIHKINNNKIHNKDMSLKMLKRIEEMMIDASVKYLVENGELHPDSSKIKNWKHPFQKTKQAPISEREAGFRIVVSETNRQSVKMPNASVSDFINYWTEKNKSETKMKWEMQQTFQISRRLLTWKKNNEKRDVKKKTSSFESKFQKTPTNCYKAWCSKCGAREFPINKWQLRDGSSCCKVEYLPEEKKHDND